MSGASRLLKGNPIPTEPVFVAPNEMVELWLMDDGTVEWRRIGRPERMAGTATHLTPAERRQLLIELLLDGYWLR